MRADPESLCTESCTDSWHHSLGLLCVRAARRTLRSSCCATNSLCCVVRSTGLCSPTRIGVCLGRLRPRFRDRAEPGGWSPPTRCWAGTGAASPGTGPNHSDRRTGHRPQRSFANSSLSWPRTIPHGVTAASTANSPGTATASLPPPCGRSSTTPEWTPHPHAAESPGRDFCTPRPRSPVTSSLWTPRCSGAATCCSSSTSPPAACSSPGSPPTPPQPGPPVLRLTSCPLLGVFSASMGGFSAER